jgi:NAD+ kinase
LKLAIFSRVINSSEKLSYVKSLFRYVVENEIPVVISETLADIGIEFDLTQVFSNAQDLKLHQVDFLVCLGGDGTILDAVLLTHDNGIPVLGIKTGRLGFLSSIENEHFKLAFEHLKKKQFEIENRMLLEINANIPIFVGENYALNDFTVFRSNSSSMIEVNVYINGELLNNYFADGLIVSTPTGSTGYNLSCGGPIIHPKNSCFILTPIAPHNLNVRPIVISDQETVTLQIQGRSPEFISTLDSRLGYITSKHKITIRKSSTMFKLVVFDENYFINALKGKLRWGEKRGV